MKIKEMIKKGKECSALVEEYLRTEDENTIVVEHNCCNFIKYFLGEVVLNFFSKENISKKHYMHLATMWSYLVIIIAALPIAVLFVNILTIFSKNFVIYWIIMIAIPFILVILIAFGNTIYIKLLQNYFPNAEIIKNTDVKAIFTSEFFNYVYWIFAIFVVAIIYFII